jgi:hypothetical protein
MTAAFTPDPDRYAHLSRCMNDWCGLPLYRVEGELVDALGHGSICDDESAPHKHPRDAASVEVTPITVEDGEVTVTTAGEATEWAVYFRLNDGTAQHVSDHKTKYDAAIDAHRVAADARRAAPEQEVPVFDHDGTPLPTVPLNDARALVGQTITAVAERQLVARDMHNEYVLWDEVTLTLDSGRHYTIALDSTEVFAPVMEPVTCAGCGDLIVKDNEEWVHPFAYDTTVPVHDPEPATTRNTDGWTEHPCNEPTDCPQDGSHLYPPAGTTVSLLRGDDAREVGKDTMHELEAGTLAVAVDYNVEFGEVIGRLDDGREVWLDPEKLTAVETDTATSASRQHYIDTGRYLTVEEVRQGILSGDISG